MTVAYINKDLLVWARKRAQFTEVEAAKKATTKEHIYLAWERGESLPTLKQAKTLASKLSIPLGYLYLDDIPDDELPLPDLRSKK